MGWTSYSRDDSPTLLADERRMVCNLFTSSSCSASCTVLASSKVGSTWYVAAKFMGASGEEKTYLPGDDGAIVVAFVILTKRVNNGEWCYKDMEESCGPYESRCPPYILDMLSPLNPEGSCCENARLWRERCRAHALSQRRLRSIKVGDRIRLPHPIRFSNGREDDTFTVAQISSGGRKTRAFIGERAGLVRIPSWRLKGYVKTGS